MSATTLGDDLRVECAWCGRWVAGPEPESAGKISHGLCVTCAAESGVLMVADLFDLTKEDADRLPWGRLVLDRAGRVVAYNRTEEQLARLNGPEVIGREFFRDVAPCTAVEEFEGRFRRLVQLPTPDREQFDFVFRFHHGARLVSLSMTWDPTHEMVMLLVSAVSES